MGDNNENLLSISQKLLKKISNRNLSASDSHSESSRESNTMMESQEITQTPQSKEQAYQNDSRFRKYVQLVEKNLQSFDAVNEWADIISFLGRLLKSFQAYPQFPIIPRKQLVAKRLAQCLNPGFPAGVHQKTLEVYAYILKTIGPNQLAEDLALWSTGLFPFVQYAATHVKPQLLNIFETYYFPLKGKLGPAMRGFIIALLSALEEEGSEYFDQVVTLLENLSETVELPFFYSCMWLVMISNPSLRPPALNYLLRKLPKIVDREAVAVVLGGRENVSLMARAFTSTLNDHQLLVQRGMLELLVQNFMLKNRMIPHDDLVMMMRAALGIVLRKDMSLNRRLYIWLLGGESGNSQTTYFNQFAEKPATQAIRSMLQEQQDTINQQRPYKILISLMDKWELGQPIVNNIFIDALNSLKSRFNPEVMQTANMWMDMMEPYTVCSKLFDMMDTCFPGNNNNNNKKTTSNNKNLENMKLIEFTLDSFKLTDEEFKQVHFPFMVATLVKKLRQSLKNPSFIEILPQVSQCISLILIMLEQLPDSVFIDRPATGAAAAAIAAEEEEQIDGGEEDETKKNKKNHFAPDMDVIEYAREFYGLSLSSQPQQEATVDPVTEEAAEENEEGGDLSISFKKQEPPQQLPHHLQQHQRQFEPLRGQFFVKEVVDNLTAFLIDLVNSYIAIPQDLLDGVDVGVEGKRLKHIDHHLEHVLLGVCTAITTMAKHTDCQVKHGDQLTQVLLKCCQQVHVFGVVDASLSTLTFLVKQDRFVDPHVLTKMTHVKAIMDQLWGFLSRTMQLLHMRTVRLIWLLTEASLSHQIETILSNYLIHGDDDVERLANYEKFGILWELSENRSMSVVFSRPMFLMLDLLREGASPLDRRAGENWIRCHLKSYVRLLEPFLVRMLDDKITTRSVEYAVTWKAQTLLNNKKKEQDGAAVTDKITQIPYYIYLKSFDTEVIDYMLTTLNTLITFGGLNVLKTFKSHLVESDGLIAKLIQSTLGIDKPMSFLELLVSISIRYLETEPSEKLTKTLTKPNRSIQLHAADLLFLMISKLDHVPMKLIQQVQLAVLNKLLYCLDISNLDLQQKLLHLLHACLVITCASATPPPQQHKRSASVDSVHSTTNNDALSLIQMSTDLFVKCVIDALTLNSNRSMLQHWMDFVLASLPYIKHGYKYILVPILMTVCHQINIRCETLDILIHQKPTVAWHVDKELLVLLLGLEKILMFCLTERNVNDDWFHKTILEEYPIPKIPETSNLMGLVDDGKPRDVMMYQLPVILHLLLNSWYLFREPQWDQETIQSLGEAQVDAILHSFTFAADQMKSRLESIFEKLFKYSTVDYVEGLVEIFFMENPHALLLMANSVEEGETGAEKEELYQWNAMDIISSTPSSTPQHVITTLLDSVRQRTPHQTRRRKILRLGKLTDISILRFVEMYCNYIKNPESIVLLWPMIHSFSKDYLSQAQTFKLMLPSLMRFLTVILDELFKSNEYEGRIRKDAQELYQRCIDYCILIAGKSFDQSLWMRSRSATTLESGNDDTASIHTVDSAETVNGATVTEKSSIAMKNREDVMILQVNQYLATHVIAKTRQLIGDNDKINSLLNNLVYYVIGPSLKSKVKNPVILDQLVEMAHMPFTYKTWRKEIWEVFLDNRFFYMTLTTSTKWLKVIGTAFSIEKERMTELLTRIMTTPSNTFFSNKDQETLNRALNLRRLSFVLFAGHLDQYVPTLPVIQEKIVELLKLDHGEMVHMEIYLLLRIILMRFSQKHLMNFWPVLITELMRLFNSFVYHDFQDRPEEAQIALAGCKFLDLLCTLELDAFQIYQWIFIRDTVETLIKPQIDGPIPIMEQLDKKLVSSSSPMDSTFDYSLETNLLQPSLGSLKRPMLTMKQINSVRQLSFFVQHVGLYVYQSSFTLSRPDLPFIESLLQNDLLQQQQQQHQEGPGVTMANNNNSNFVGGTEFSV